ncbi:MAG: histidine--tRNA ligase [Chloroflexi bacterium]|nr:histidine--tRNA ligase [Chloroflexota bacterium]
MYKAPRGAADILPEDQPYWIYTQQCAERVSCLFGYQRLDTPTFEDAGLFIRSVGAGTDIVEKEMYSFEDRGGNTVTLRPEGTAPVCRAYLEHGMHNLPQPVRLYYFAPLFRYERPQAGRYREHHQFGYEALGDADPAVDAEVIEMAWRLYQELGLKDLSLQLNSIGCLACRPAYLSRLKEYYGGHTARLCRDCTARLERNALRLLDCKTEGCLRMGESAPRSVDHLCVECKAHFESLQSYLRLMGLPFTLNHRLVRGLDYYTRTVFEIQPAEEGAQSTVGGGGRYDGLVEELGGRPTPGVGFATGIERIVLNLKRQGVAVPPLPGPQVFIANLGPGARNEAVSLASQLRAAGVGATLGPGSRSLKAQLRQANARGVGQAIIIGDEEVRQGTVVLRDMARGTQQYVPVSDLLDALRAAQRTRKDE